MVEFLKSLSGLKHRNEIISDIKYNAERMEKDTISLSILNNLVVNYEAAAGKVGIEIAKYFSLCGGDAHVDSRYGNEVWLIVFNPQILKKVSVVNPNKDIIFELPKNIK